MLKTMDDHTKLSFTHIMKHWKKGNTLTPAGPKNSSNSPGSQGRSVLLRYYPPPSKGTPPFSFLLGCVNKAEIHQALLSQFSLLGEFFNENEPLRYFSYFIGTKQFLAWNVLCYKTIVSGQVTFTKSCCKCGRALCLPYNYSVLPSLVVLWHQTREYTP